MKNVLPFNHENGPATTISAKELAKAYTALGIVPVPLAGKRPAVQDWPNYQPDIEKDFNDPCTGVGGLLGTRSGNKVSIDLDWIECDALAKYFLPDSWSFGRNMDSGKFALRHNMLRCQGVKTTKFDAPPNLFDGSRRIVEILSEGTQVVLPMNRHVDTGEEIKWKNRPSKVKLAEIDPDDLLKRVQHMAGTALLVKLWPDLEGSRHDISMHLVGACIHAGWKDKEIERMVKALLSTVDDREGRDRANAVIGTIKRAKEGKSVTGLNTLADYLDPPVIDCLKKWWGLGKPAVELTFNGQKLENSQPATPFAAVWPELLEFENLSASTQEYPTERLGPIMSAAVKEVVRVQKVPGPLASQSILTTASGAVQPLFDIELDLRRIPLSLWMVTVASAGERKTSTDKLVRKQTDIRRKEASAAWRVLMSNWKAQRTDSEAGDPGPAPRQPSWISTRGSVEGLLKQMYNHCPATILSTADAGGWFGGFSMREGRSTATISVLSDLWSGEAHTTVLASSDEALDLLGRRLSISFMLQPNIAADLFYTELLRGQGFLSRFLPTFPTTTIGTRLYQPSGNTPALQRYWAAIDELLLQRPNMNLDSGELMPAALPLSGEALSMWIEAHDDVERSQAIGREHEALRDIANKMAEQALRLAGIRSVIEGEPEISAASMQGGIDLMKYYLTEWLNLAGKLQAHRTEVSEPRHLWEWMEKRRNGSETTVVTLRDAYKNGPRFIRNQSQKARELIAELLRRGYVRVNGKGYEIRPEDEM